MKRVLEPELMEDQAQVTAYAQADFSVPHNDFVQRVVAMVNEPTFFGKALDLGCGPGDISRRLALAMPYCTVDAVDGSKAMLAYALNSTAPELQTRLKFIDGKLPNLRLAETDYDLIISNSLLHHLSDPQTLWQTVSRFAKSGTRIMVMDLLRPKTTDIAQTMVAKYAENEPDILQRDFYYSLLAAFTLDEIEHQLLQAELKLKVEQISDRHVVIAGIVH